MTRARLFGRRWARASASSARLIVGLGDLVDRGPKRQGLAAGQSMVSAARGCLSCREITMSKLLKNLRGKDVQIAQMC